MEGSPSQEISAIHMNALTKQIVDVYHAHANTYEDDSWARRYIHGLNMSFLERHGFRDEIALITNFKDWLSSKNIMSIYANDPTKEAKLLNINISDIRLPPWAKRVYQSYHQMANDFKRDFVPIMDKRCCPKAHNMYQRYPIKRLSATEIAKREHGFHCSLYDAYELYLYYVTT